MSSTVAEKKLIVNSNQEFFQMVDVLTGELLDKLYDSSLSIKSFFPNSNERMLETIAALTKHEWRKKTPKELRIFFGIGEGNVFSLLPVLKKGQFDLVCLGDISIQMVQHLQFMEGLVRAVATAKEFEGRYLSEHPLIDKHVVDLASIDDDGKSIIKKVLVTKEFLKAQLEQNKALLGDKHFLAGENFQSYKKIIENIPFCYLPIDITKLEQIKSFLTILTKAFPKYEIQFALCNFSNVFDYDAKEHIFIATAKKQEFKPSGKLLSCTEALLKKATHPVIMYAHGKNSAYCIDWKQFRGKMKEYVEKTNKEITASKEKSLDDSKSKLQSFDKLGLTLRKMSANTNTVDEDYKEAVSNAKKAGVINSPSSNGRTALHWAALSGNQEKYDLLVANGADKTLEDKEGQSAAKYLEEALKKKLEEHDSPIPASR